MQRRNGFGRSRRAAITPLLHAKKPVGWIELLRNPSACRVLRWPFSEIRAIIREIACPILGIDPELHHAVERRIRPIRYPRHKPMLDRVDMNVIDVSREIIVIANGMLPIAPLPDAAFAFGGAAV